MPTPVRTMRHRLICRLLLAPLLFCCAALAAQAQPADAVTAARLQPGERLALDGTLSHPAWQRAPVWSRFVEKDPHNGAEPPQRTQVQVLYGEDAVWVGITAFDDQPARIRDVPVRYDGVNRTQDFVVVYVDPIGTKRSAQFFRVSAAGSLADGLHTAADDSEDFAPDFDWDAAVQRHAGGWTAVLRLPFASLRFAEGEQQSWRFMVARRLPREQFHLVASVPIPLDAPSFIHTMQPLLGVQLPQRHGFLTLRPSLTLRRAQEVGDGAPRRSSSDIDASLDLKWRPHAELVVDATLNPDFSQIALDVPQLAGNTRFALSLAEKRPFFFESADLLRSPTEAFYTRSLTAPRWGLRGTWRGPQWAGSLLAVDDRGGGRVLLPGAYDTESAEQPASRALAARVRKDEGGLQWGGVLAARRYADDVGDNLVLGPDVGVQISEAWRVRAQWLASQTTALPDKKDRLRREPAVDAQRLYVKAQRLVDDGESVITLDDIGEGFRHDGGFVNQAGVRSISLFHSHGWRRIGPFNEFFINVQADQVRDRRTGEVIKEVVRPGFWSSAARNLEWWTEFHLHSRVRPRAGEPLLAERYVLSGLVMSPAEWFPLIDTHVSVGRLADTVAEQVRPGVRFDVSGKLRPMRPLEVEPSLSTAWLRDGGRRTYSETATQLLAVWHFDAHHTLRAIVQRIAFERLAEQSRSRNVSLTYTWRRSSGTVLYLGASRAHEAAGHRSTEAYLKLQFDIDEARARLF
jgi:Domain of unknown function (DUF5916)